MMHILTLLGLLATPIVSVAQPAPLPKKIAQAWQDAGAAVRLQADAADPAAAARPVFHFEAFPTGKLAGLPPPDFPFGLSFGRPGTTDAALRELRGLKQARSLSLSFTGVTDRRDGCRPGGARRPEGLTASRPFFALGDRRRHEGRRRPQVAAAALACTASS